MSIKHEVWVDKADGAPVVMMANDDDSHYVQAFRSREDLSAFVQALCAAADEAWPKNQKGGVKTAAQIRRDAKHDPSCVGAFARAKPR